MNIDTDEWYLNEWYLFKYNDKFLIKYSNITVRTNFVTNTDTNEWYLDEWYLFKYKDTFLIKYSKITFITQILIYSMRTSKIPKRNNSFCRNSTKADIFLYEIQLQTEFF